MMPEKGVGEKIGKAPKGCRETHIRYNIGTIPVGEHLYGWARPERYALAGVRGREMPVIKDVEQISAR